MKCENKATHFSPDYKTILCVVDKEREENFQNYEKLAKTDQQIDKLLDNLDFTFINFNICIAISRMFLKEERIKRRDLSELEDFKEKLRADLKKLEQKFIDGTLHIRNLNSLR
jgi:hypothetical protein